MTHAVKNKTVEIAGLPVHYREAGEGETIVFLHGAGGAPPEGASFPAMLAENHQLLIPSRPGFDETPIGDCATEADVAEIVAGFVREAAGGPVHVVAQSAGGAIGCWLAVLHPDLVAGLVLSAPAAFAVRPPREGDGPPDPRELDLLLYGETPCWSAPPTAEDEARIRRNAQANMARFHAPGGSPGLLERLGEISAPTLLVMGTGDRMLLPESLLPFQQHIPHHHRVFIYGAAHELPISAGPQWVALVRDFIARGETFVVNAGTRRLPPAG